MRIGQPGDPRRFDKRKHDDAEATKDIPWRCPDKAKYCEICGLKITGYYVRGSKSGRYVCFRCNNEPL